VKRILRSLYGQKLGTADDYTVLSEQGFLAGVWGRQMAIADLRKFVVFDDFDGATLLGTWQVAKGTDGAAANFALNGGLSGTIQGTTGATTTTMAGSGIQIAAHLNLQAQGAAGAAATNDLEFDVKVQTSAITGLCLFVGYTSQVAALQMPIQGAGGGNGFTVNNNNCVGFLYDTNMTTQDWWCVGAKAGVAANGIDCGSGPTAAAWDQFHISIDQLGNANFWRNAGGSILTQPVQMPPSGSITMANAVNPTTPLTPVIAAFSRIAVSKNITADYILGSMDRI
jgi:hypothetical protein